MEVERSLRCSTAAMALFCSGGRRGAGVGTVWRQADKYAFRALPLSTRWTASAPISCRLQDDDRLSSLGANPLAIADSPGPRVRLSRRRRSRSYARHVFTTTWARVEVTAHPRDMLARWPTPIASQADRVCSPTTTTILHGDLSRGPRDHTPRTCARSIRRPRWTSAPACPCSAAPLQEQRRAAAVDAIVVIPAVAARRAAGAGVRSKGGEADALHQRRGALLGPCLQGRRRPLRGQAHVLPGLLRHAQGRLVRATTRAKTSASASAASFRCTPTIAKTVTRSSPASWPPPWGSSTRPPARRSASRATPSSWNRSEFPEPVICGGHRAEDQGRRGEAGQLAAAPLDEDPTFRVRTDEETGQTIIAGMGELHLEIIVDRLVREFNVDANVGKPQVAYRETIATRSTRSRAASSRQSGGRGQYGHVVIKMQPNEPGGGYKFESRIQGGASRATTSRRWTTGIQEAMSTGVLAGYPVVDIKVALIDGSFHEVDSSDMAFKIAGSLAFKNAAQKAKPVLLEPMMAVEVVTPSEFMGDVIGDLNSRRGHIDGMEPRGERSGRSRPRCRCPPCSGTLPMCGPPRRAGRPTPCSSDITPRFPRRSPQRSSPRCAAHSRANAAAICPSRSDSVYTADLWYGSRRAAFCVTSTFGFREKE